MPNKVLERELSRLKYPNGKMYKGGFMNDKPHGRGILYNAKGEAMDVVFDMGSMVKGNN